MLTGSAQQVVGAIEAIQAAGGYWFGTQSDQSVQWPSTVVVSQVFNWVPVIEDMLAQRANGVLGGIAYNLTLANGGLTFKFGSVGIAPQVLVAAGNATEAILSGEIVVARELPE